METNIGVFALIAFIALWIFLIMVRAVHAVLNTPKAIAVYKEKTSHQKGMQALAYGLSAVAAGDVRMAQYYTKRSTKNLKHDFGLNALLSGLSARLSGDQKQAEKSFQTLLNHKETSILGLKGLLKTAMKKGDYRYARVLIEQTITKTPNQPWILNAQYDLELKTNHYDQALVILEKLRKNDAVSKTDYMKDKSILLMLADKIEKAYKLDSQSLPITLNYLKKLSDNNKRRKSLNVIKRQWMFNPHPRLLDYWIKYAPKKSIADPMKMAAWIEDLHYVNSAPASSSLYCAEALMRLNQKDQAQRFVKKAMTKHPTTRTYQMMHQIDPNGEWLEQIQNAKADMAWVCAQSRTIYDEWQPVTNFGDFNTVTWAYPDQVKNKAVANQNNGLIDFIQSAV